MSVKVRDFIRSIRACKTAAEERAFISKECALIRTAFKEGDSTYRHRNVAKLLFIHMMGYPTHFGQLECLKLIASPRFAEKRIGYLGLTQVLDENAEVLMLVTNSIKNDLQHPSQYINGLAICALGTVGTVEMCRSLTKEIEDKIRCSNPYIRKKAILCGLRIVKRIPDIEDRFNDLIPPIFEDKNHGVLLAGCAFVQALVETNPAYLAEMRLLMPQLLLCLKHLVMMAGYSTSTEYDVAGVADPFLQVRLLRLMRILQKDAPAPNEDLTDLVTQISANTEATKGAGNAVLLECVSLIFTIQSDASLYVLGTNILGRFLLNKDTNIRYVALASLQQVIRIDSRAVQKHRNTVVECLKDPDVSIRRRALEVTFALIDADNIKLLFKELLGLLIGTSGNSASLSNDDKQFRADLVSKICLAAERFAPSRRWQIDTLIRVFAIAGDYVHSEFRDSFVYLLSLTPELQSYAVHKLYFAVRENPGQQALVHVAVWAIGEFGDLLVSGKEIGPTGTPIEIQPSDVLDFLEMVRRSVAAARQDSKASMVTSASVATFGALNRDGGGGGNFAATSSIMGPGAFVSVGGEALSEILLTTLVKLTTRMPPGHVDQIGRMLKTYSSDISVELQQRSSEYAEILSPIWNEYRDGILDRMPVGQKGEATLAAIMSRPPGDVSIDEVPVLSATGSRGGTDSPRGRKGRPTTSSSSTDLLDLGDLLDMTVPASTPAAKPSLASSNGAGGADLLLTSIGNQQPPQTSGTTAMTHETEGEIAGGTMQQLLSLDLL